MPDVTIQGTDTTVSFPDTMSQADIAKALDTHPLVREMRRRANAPTPQQVEQNYHANAPKTPANVKTQDIAQYRSEWLDNPDDVRTPRSLVNSLSQLPLGARENFLKVHEYGAREKLSDVGRAAILQKAYEENATLPTPGHVLRSLATARLGITPGQAKREGVAPAVANAQSRRKTEGIARQERALTARGGTDDYEAAYQNQREPVAPLPSTTEALTSPLTAPAEIINTIAGSLVAGKPMRGGILPGLAERLDPGGAEAYQNVPGNYAAAARAIGSFFEPGNLALMKGLGPVSKTLGPVGTYGIPAALMGPQITHAGSELLQGRPGEALGIGGGFLLLGAFHGAQGAEFKAELKRFEKRGGDLSPNALTRLDAIFQKEPGFTKSALDAAKNPDPELAAAGKAMLNQMTYAALYPKKYAAEQKAAANAQAQSQALSEAQQGAVRQEVVPGQPTPPSFVRTPAVRQQPPVESPISPEVIDTQGNVLPDIEEAQRAVQIPSPAPEVPRAAGAGQDQPEGRGGVRSGEQGAKPAGEGQTADTGRQEAVGAQKPPGKAKVKPHASPDTFSAWIASQQPDRVTGARSLKGLYAAYQEQFGRTSKAEFERALTGVVGENMEAVLPDGTNTKADRFDFTDSTGVTRPIVGLKPKTALVKAQSGNSGTTSTPKGTQVPFHYAVVEADSLIPSHSDSGAETPGYDQAMQPRNRSGKASQQQIEDIAQKLDFARAADAPTTENGAPLVGPDLHVESGNGRTLGIRRAIEKYPEKYAQYVVDLKARAASLGMDPASLEGVKKPVLVRINEIAFHSPESRAEFAREAGHSSVARMDATEVAAADARALHASDSLMRYNPNLDLSAAGNQDFVSRFMKQVPQSEHNAFIDTDGKLSLEGKQRMLSAIIAAAYDDRATVERLVNESNPDIKQVGNAMKQVANAVAVLKQAIKNKAAHPLDISEELVEAANRYKDIKNRDTTVEEDLQNADVFGGELSPEVEALLHLFETKNSAGKVTTRNAASIAKMLGYYIDLAFKQGDPSQAIEGGIRPPTKLELLETAGRKIHAEEATPSLFGEPAESSQPTPEVPGRTERTANTTAESAKAAPEPKVSRSQELKSKETEADRIIAEAEAKLRKKKTGGKSFLGVDITDIPDYIQLAYGYMRKGVVKVEQIFEKFKTAFPEHFPNITDADFKTIYQGAKRLYQATVTSGDPDAPLAEPFPGTADEKYVGSRNVKVPGYSIETIEALRRDYARNRAIYDAQKAQETLEDYQRQAAQPGVLPDNWEKADPATLLDPAKIIAMHNATNASRAKLEAARATGNQADIEKYEVELTRREAAYQSAANLWGKTGAALKSLGIQEAYDPRPAERVNQLLNPTVRQGTNKGAPKIFSPQAQVKINSEIQALKDIWKEVLSKPQGLGAGGAQMLHEVFTRGFPHLVEIGKIVVGEGYRNFGQFSDALLERLRAQGVEIDENQAQQIFATVSKQTPKKSKATVSRQTTPNSQPSTTGEFPARYDPKTGESLRPGQGSKRSGQTPLPGTTETTTGQFQRTGTGKAGMQGRVEGTTPEMAGNPDRPGVKVGDQAALEGEFPTEAQHQAAIGAKLDARSEFIPEGRYKEALERIKQARREIPKSETEDPTKLAMRDIQIQGALSDIGLYHMQTVSNAVGDGKFKPSSLRSEWGKRMRGDIGDWATKPVLNDVYNAVRVKAEIEAGVRSQARDITRRNMTRGLSAEHTDALGADLAKLDEADPRYYEKLDDLARKYMALSRSGTENAVQNWLAYRRANILSSPRTIAKVLLSHGIFLGAEELARIPAAITDSLISAKFGTGRTVLGPNVAEIANAAQIALTQGVREAANIVRHGERGAERLGMRRIGSAQVNETVGEIQMTNRLGNAYANAITRMHSAAYRPFKVYAFVRSLSEQARMMEKNGQAVDAKALMDSPTDAMVIKAIEDAEEATFLNKNKIADVLGSAGKGQPVVDFFLPIRKVPLNIWGKTIEYGTGWTQIFRLLKPDFRAKLQADGVTQQQFSRTFGRGTVGLGIMTLGALGAYYGVVQGVNRKNRVGKVKAFGYEADLGALPPIGTLLTAGATAQELAFGRQQGDKPYLSDIINLSAENPLVRTMEMFANTYDPSGAQIGASYLHSGLVPLSQAVSDLAEQMDDRLRKTSGPGFDLPREEKNKLPGLRRTLPPKKGYPSNKLLEPLNIRKATR